MVEKDAREDVVEPDAAAAAPADDDAAPDVPEMMLEPKDDIDPAGATGPITSDWLK